MQVFDASSVIYAWDNYPLNQFPPLWNWMASEINTKAFLMSKVAFEQVDHKFPECGTWLKDKGIQRIDVSNDILQEAMRIKRMLGISGDKYHPKGVDEKDILIIATARIWETELVSDEARQHMLPDKKTKMKIPAVCDLEGVGVPCVSFIELIKRSEMVFQ